jgi:exodeoxyribonuclease VIII
MQNQILENTLLTDLSNEDYHANKTHLSSSCFKAILKDLSRFHKEWVLGKKEHREPSSALIEGSYAHTLLLEPHLAHKEYAIWNEWHKRGKAFQEFKASTDLPILSEAQVKKVQSWVKSIKRLEPLQELVTGGIAEASLFTNLYDLPIKVRFDYIIPEKGIIFDLKTSRKEVDPESFTRTVEEYGYHVSAALYLDAAEKHYGRPFKFYYGAISKWRS